MAPEKPPSKGDSSCMNLYPSASKTPLILRATPTKSNNSSLKFPMTAAPPCAEPVTITTPMTTSAVLKTRLSYMEAVPLGKTKRLEKNPCPPCPTAEAIPTALTLTSIEVSSSALDKRQAVKPETTNKRPASRKGPNFSQTRARTASPARPSSPSSSSAPPNLAQKRASHSAMTSALSSARSNEDEGGVDGWLAIYPGNATPPKIPPKPKPSHDKESEIPSRVPSQPDDGARSSHSLFGSGSDTPSELTEEDDLTPAADEESSELTETESDEDVIVPAKLVKPKAFKKRKQIYQVEVCVPRLIDVLPQSQSRIIMRRETSANSHTRAAKSRAVGKLTEIERQTRAFQSREYFEEEWGALVTSVASSSGFRDMRRSTSRPKKDIDMINISSDSDDDVPLSQLKRMDHQIASSRALDPSATEDEHSIPKPHRVMTKRKRAIVASSDDEAVVKVVKVSRSTSRASSSLSTFRSNSSALGRPASPLLSTKSKSSTLGPKPKAQAKTMRKVTSSVPPLLARTLSCPSTTIGHSKSPTPVLKPKAVESESSSGFPCIYSFTITKESSRHNILFGFAGVGGPLSWGEKGEGVVHGKKSGKEVDWHRGRSGSNRSNTWLLREALLARAHCKEVEAEDICEGEWQDVGDDELRDRDTLLACKGLASLSPVMLASSSAVGDQDSPSAKTSRSISTCRTPRSRKRGPVDVRDRLALSRQPSHDKSPLDVDEQTLIDLGLDEIVPMRVDDGTIDPSLLMNPGEERAVLLQLVHYSGDSDSDDGRELEIKAHDVRVEGMIVVEEANLDGSLDWKDDSKQSLNDFRRGEQQLLNDLRPSLDDSQQAPLHKSQQLLDDATATSHQRNTSIVVDEQAVTLAANEVVVLPPMPRPKPKGKPGPKPKLKAADTCASLTPVAQSSATVPAPSGNPSAFTTNTSKSYHDRWPRASSCDPVWCHFCRRKVPHMTMQCGYGTCDKRFCVRCTCLRFPSNSNAGAETLYTFTLTPTSCPFCDGRCPCDICTRRRGEAYIKPVWTKEKMREIAWEWCVKLGQAVGELPPVSTVKASKASKSTASARPKKNATRNRKGYGVDPSVYGPNHTLSLSRGLKRKAAQTVFYGEVKEYDSEEDFIALPKAKHRKVEEEMSNGQVETGIFNGWSILPPIEQGSVFWGALYAPDGAHRIGSAFVPVNELSDGVLRLSVQRSRVFVGALQPEWGLGPGVGIERVMAEFGGHTNVENDAKRMYIGRPPPRGGRRSVDEIGQTDVVMDPPPPPNTQDCHTSVEPPPPHATVQPPQNTIGPPDTTIEPPQATIELSQPLIDPIQPIEPPQPIESPEPSITPSQSLVASIEPTRDVDRDAFHILEYVAAPHGVGPPNLIVEQDTSRDIVINGSHSIPVPIFDNQDQDAPYDLEEDPPPYEDDREVSMDISVADET